MHGVVNARNFRVLVSMAVAVERAAHEKLQACTVNVQDDGKRNVQITPQVDVVGIGNVMNDEVSRYKLVVVSVIGVVTMRIVRCFCLVLGVLFVDIVMTRRAVSVVLSQNSCSCEDEQGGEKGPE